jgi:hypothetical protein
MNAGRMFNPSPTFAADVATFIKSRADNCQVSDQHFASFIATIIKINVCILKMLDQQHSSECVFSTNVAAKQLTQTFIADIDSFSVAVEYVA